MPECVSWCQHFGQKASGNIVAWLFASREMMTIQMVGGALARPDEHVSLRDGGRGCNFSATVRHLRLPALAQGRFRAACEKPVALTLHLWENPPVPQFRPERPQLWQGVSGLDAARASR
jgi:hypothetical protein